MDYIAGIGTVLTQNIPAFLFILMIIVFIHELGHFLVARWCGVRVEVFSIGFGPELFSRLDRYQTRWRIAAIPLGGYVKFFGDENAASKPDAEAMATMSDDERAVSFPNKPIWQRAAIVAAGPLANFILAIVILTCLFMFVGRQITVARVDMVQENSPAAMAGFQANDIIQLIDGKTIKTFSDVQKIVSVSADTPLKIIVQRGDQNVELLATPDRRKVETAIGRSIHIGVLGIQYKPKAGDISHQKLGLINSLDTALDETWFIITTTLKYVGKLLSGRESAEQLSGPIGVAKMAGQAATLGFAQLMGYMALISISIGLVNLFPIPILDGGHLVFYAIEAIMGRPVGEKIREYSFQIGFVLIMSLMVFATWNDLFAS